MEFVAALIIGECMKVLNYSDIKNTIPDHTPQARRLINLTKTMSESDLWYEVMSILDNTWIHGYVSKSEKD